MPDIRTIAKYLGVYGAGVVTAGFFLSGPVERPAEVQPNTTAHTGWVMIPPTTPFTESLTNPPLAHPAAEPPQSPPPAMATDRSERPNVETTGSSARGAEANAPDRNQTGGASARRALQRRALPALLPLVRRSDLHI